MRLTNRFFHLVALALLLVGATTAEAGSSGAIFTTNYNGTFVNGNVYDFKEDVYLNGGPQANKPCTKPGLPDGLYVFQVTDPSGKELLSMDLEADRKVRVWGGVIVEDPMVAIKLQGKGRPAGGGGRKLGELEEYFVEQLSQGDTFVFAGDVLRFEGLREDAAYVTRASDPEAEIPSYNGGKFPLSTFLAQRVREMVSNPRQWEFLPGPVGEWLAVQEARIVAGPPIFLKVAPDLGEGEPDQSRLCDRCEMVGRRAEVMAVGDASERNAVAPRALDRFLDRQGTGRKGQTARSVHEASRAVLFHDLRLRFPVDAVLPQVLRIQRNARQPVPGQPLGLGGDQCLRRRLRRRIRRSRALQRPSRQRCYLFDRALHVDETPAPAIIVARDRILFNRAWCRIAAPLRPTSPPRHDRTRRTRRAYFPTESRPAPRISA